MKIFPFILFLFIVIPCEARSQAFTDGDSQKNAPTSVFLKADVQGNGRKEDVLVNYSPITEDSLSSATTIIIKGSNHRLIGRITLNTCQNSAVTILNLAKGPKQQIAVLDHCTSDGGPAVIYEYQDKKFVEIFHSRMGSASFQDLTDDDEDELIVDIRWFGPAHIYKYDPMKKRYVCCDSLFSDFYKKNIEKLKQHLEEAGDYRIEENKYKGQGYTMEELLQTYCILGDIKNFKELEKEYYKLMKYYKNEKLSEYSPRDISLYQNYISGIDQKRLSSHNDQEILLEFMSEKLERNVARLCRLKMALKQKGLLKY